MRFGIEAEYAVLRPGGDPVDWAAPDADVLQRAVDRLPDHADADLTRGDLAIKWTRWYVEGDERFDAAGGFLRCVPKGIETRTPISPGIAEALGALAGQTRQLQDAVAVDGLRLGAIGYHPFRRYRPDPAYNAWELSMRGVHPEYAAAEVYMCSFGPDVNISHPDWDAAQVLQVAARLAGAAPALVAFALNSPFAGGRRTAGYSVRTQVRAGRRPTVRAFLERPPDGALGVPGLAAVRARIPSEVGRVEFKAFDAFADLALFGPLLALVAGVAVSGTVVPAVGDPVEVLRRVGRSGFDDPEVRAACAAVLEAAGVGLARSPEISRLEPLARTLAGRRVPAHDLLEEHRRAGRITVPELRLPTERRP
jgi:hypothetical protein